MQILKSPLPALGLMFNALVWGTSWWSFRQLNAQGLHPLWTTVLVYLVAVGAIWMWRPHAFGQVLRTPVLWVLLLASGTTNAAFNWGVVIGDVVRIVLLFYLMPLWTAILARVLLREPLTRGAAVRVLCALLGAAIVLSPEEGVGLSSLPVPRTLPDWLGVLGGFSFALNNVMLRREAEQPDECRAMAMFLGGVLVAGALATVLTFNSQVSSPVSLSVGWIFFALGLAVLFLLSNLSLQYGVSRLPANVTSVIMLTEIVFASGSAMLLDGGTLTPRLMLGGSLIMSAALLAAFEPSAA